MKTPTLARAALPLVAAVALLVPATAAAATGGDFKAEYDKGVAAFGAGDYATALTQFEKAYAIKPHPLCLFNIGQAHRKMDHFDEAIAAYEKYLATKPDADLRAETEGYVAEMKRAKEAKVDAAEARRLLLAGDAAGAAVRFERAYAVHPQPHLLAAIGTAYERAGNKAKAIEYYERFLKSEADATLKSDAAEALAKLRSEPDAPAGSTSGGKALDAGRADSAAGRSGGSRVALYAGIGGGAAVVVATLAVVLAVTLGRVRPGDTALGFSEAHY